MVGICSADSRFIACGGDTLGEFSSRLGLSTSSFPALFSTRPRRKKGKKSAIQVDNAYPAGAAMEVVQLYVYSVELAVPAPPDVPVFALRTSLSGVTRPARTASRQPLVAPWTSSAKAASRRPLRGVRTARTGRAPQTVRGLASAGRFGGYGQYGQSGHCVGGRPFPRGLPPRAGGGSHVFE